MFAVVQLIPGAIGINPGDYVGLRAAGVPGALVAAAVLVSAPIAIIIAITRLYNGFLKNRVVRGVFDGIRRVEPRAVQAGSRGLVSILEIARAGQNHKTKRALKPARFSLQ
jgi:chromate transporter